MKYTVYNQETAPTEEGQKTLAQIKSHYGFLPNLMGVLAESQPVLESYLHLGKQLEKSTLNAQEIQVVYLAANYENDCHYCMAAHSTVAHGMKMPEHFIDVLRTGKDLDDPKLSVLAGFTREVVRQRGWVNEEEIQKFLSGGYTKANVLDVILAVSHKTISNYVNHINETDVDPAFKKYEWSRS